MSESPRFRVLVFPGGTEIGLEIRSALLGIREVELHAASAPVGNHAPFVFQRYHTLPSVFEPGWLSALNQLIEREGINFVFPAHDDALLALAEAREQLTATVVTSPTRTCQIARSKRLTYEHLRDTVPVPELYEAEATLKFPVFLKPDRGQGAQNTFRVDRVEELESLRQLHGDLLITEYLPGEEYTVDCFSDREQGLLFCSARSRTRIRNGIAMNSRPVDDAAGEFRRLAEAIQRVTPLHGVWFFQVKRDARGSLKVMEFAPRVAGTMAVHRVQGVNLPLLSIYEQLREPLAIMPLAQVAEVDRALCNRFRCAVDYSTVYCDLDDTLIRSQGVDLLLVKFLYQCVNRGKQLILLTRHRYDVQQTLSRYRLQSLFDQIVVLRADEKKSDYIRVRDAIFIDDSFRERAEVHCATGVATFDLSMIEVLIDDRS